ncbi:MAG: hypothetical protein P8Q54_02435 [Akkermansiaceae bacterium]|nr:hypothetical protein [Akkermansiaceae bacterium]MDG1362309.1 hypothetical protein [Akkermansiaceae bacterium]
MRIFITSLLATALLVSAQDEPAAETKSPKKGEKPQFVIDLEALSKEDTVAYSNAFRRANSLFQQKRIFESLEALEEVDAIYAKNPASLTLRGACYVEFRAFDKARMVFAKSLEISPGNFNVRFNVAEIEFVTKNYAKSLEILEPLLLEAKKNRATETMTPLIKFKIALCKIKTGDLPGAEAIVAETDFLDDSPLFYFGKAALHYAEKDGVGAEQWLARATRIFRSSNGSLLAPWQDTLIEFGYIKSFYGGDLEVESGISTGSEGK